MLVTIGNFFFRYRNAVFPFAFVLVFLPGPRLLPDPFVALAIGAAIALLGQVVRVLTIGLKYIIRGGRHRRVYAEDLVTDGLYAHTRNPMYIGNLLILAGVAVASNSIPCLLTAVPLFVLIYVSIVAAEEDFLRRKFGEAFDAYTHDVPRWGLTIAGLADTLRSMEFRWRRVVVKEYGTPFGWISGLCLLGLLYLRNPTVADMHPNARAVLILILTMAAVFWLTARWVKKARIVIAD